MQRAADVVEAPVESLLLARYHAQSLVACQGGPLDTGCFSGCLPAVQRNPLQSTHHLAQAALQHNPVLTLHLHEKGRGLKGAAFMNHVVVLCSSNGDQRHIMLQEIRLYTCTWDRHDPRTDS
jgi:hypothetical protein